MFTKHLIKSLQRSSEGIHQDLLTIAYADWQSAGDWSYADMLKNTREKYSELVEFAVLIGKYNQQVCNGGHLQYWDNGYAGAGSGAFCYPTDAVLHERLIELFNKFEFNKLKFGNAVYVGLMSFLQSAKLPGDCYECHGAGGWDESDDDGGNPWFDECGNCGGSGDDDTNIEDVSHLDSAYFDVSSEWEAAMEKFFLEAFESAQKASVS